MKTAESEIRKQQKYGRICGVLGIICCICSIPLALVTNVWFIFGVPIGILFSSSCFAAASAFGDALEFMKKEREGKL